MFVFLFRYSFHSFILRIITVVVEYRFVFLGSINNNICIRPRVNIVAYLSFTYLDYIKMFAALIEEACRMF